MSEYGSGRFELGNMERPDLGSERPDWGLTGLHRGFRGFIVDLRLDLGSERPNLGSKLGSQRPNLSLRG